MIGLKILISTYSTAFLSAGGGESELVQVADILNKYGFEADIYGITSRPIDYYDAIFHFSVHADGLAIYNAYINEGKKVILWPNVWWLEPPLEPEVERIRYYTDNAHKIIFKSETEKNNFIKYIPLEEDKYIVSPICILKSYFDNPDRALAKTLCDFESYVLCLGRIEPIKNQLAVVQALTDLGVNGVFAGGSVDEQYFSSCRAHGKDLVQFLPYIKPCSSLLVSLIASSQAVIEIGFDPAGRSSLEAALLGRPLVLSDDEWTDEYFDNLVLKADPRNQEEIVKAIEMAVYDAEAEKRSVQALQHVAQSYGSPACFDKFVTTIVDACD